MSKPETSLPDELMFDRRIALITVRALSYNKVHAQAQLLTFFEFTEDDDDELLCAIAAKLDPNRGECRRTLLDMATSVQFDREVAMVALDQLYMINSWKERKSAYTQIVDMRYVEDIIWQIADGYIQALSNVFDLEELRQ